MANCQRCGRPVVDQGGLPCPRCGNNRLGDSSHPRDPLLKLDDSPDSRVEAAVREFEEDLELTTPQVRVTPALIGLNVTVFLLMVLLHVGVFSPSREDLIRWGANFGEATLSGEPWRLFSSMFVHIGIVHILVNMFVLWKIGPLVERILGPVRFAVIYLASGLCGSLVSVLWHPPSVVSAGASGAIFGLFGALLGFLLRDGESVPKEVHGALLKNASLLIVYNVVYGALHAGTDVADHLGGLVGGFAFGVFLATPLTATRAGPLPASLENWFAEASARIEGKRQTGGNVSLSKDERLVYELWLLDTEIRKGGLTLYFANHGLEQWEHCVALASEIIPTFARFASMIDKLRSPDSDLSGIGLTAALGSAGRAQRLYHMCRAAIITELHDAIGSRIEASTVDGLKGGG